MTAQLVADSKAALSADTGTKILFQGTESTMALEYRIEFSPGYKRDMISVSEEEGSCVCFDSSRRVGFETFLLSVVSPGRDWNQWWKEKSHTVIELLATHFANQISQHSVNFVIEIG